MAETLSYDNTPDTSVLSEEEQNSLEVGKALREEQDQLLAGKYKSAEELEKAYVELQKKLGEPRDEVQTTENESEPAAEEPEEQESSDGETLSKEQADHLMEMVGGEKAYKSMLEWAGSNFSKDEIEMYDGIMNEGNPSAVFFAVQALQARYNDGVGSDGQTLTGRGAENTDDSFKSQAELVAAMSDPRYDRDPAYRADLMRRLENSDVSF